MFTWILTSVLLMLNLCLWIGNICNGLLLGNASIARGLTCCKKLARHEASRKSWSTKFPLGGEVNHIWPLAYDWWFAELYKKNPGKVCSLVMSWQVKFAELYDAPSIWRVERVIILFCYFNCSSIIYISVFISFVAFIILILCLSFYHSNIRLYNKL